MSVEWLPWQQKHRFIGVKVINISPQNEHLLVLTISTNYEPGDMGSIELGMFFNIHCYSGCYDMNGMNGSKS